MPVEHAGQYGLLRYILETEGMRIYYSGDSARMPERIAGMLKDGKLDAVYHDTSLHNPPSPSHCYVGVLEETVPEQLRHKVYCMHLDGGVQGHAGVQGIPGGGGWLMGYGRRNGIAG